MAHQNRNMSKKKKAVADGVFNSELNEFLTRQLDADGYTGVQVRVTPIRTEIVIQATRAREIVGEKGRRINELTTLIERRFRFREGSVELNVKRVDNRGMCADAQAESLRFKLLKGLAVRRACYGVVRFIMDNGATGCEVVVSGKLRAQRAKAMKFRDGYLISSGEPKNQYIQYAVRHVLMRQGVLGIKVKIMLAYDKEGVNGCSMLMPDKVIVSEPKEDEVIDHQDAVENPDAEEAVDEEVHQEAKELVEQEMEEQALQEQQLAEEQQQEQQVVEEQPQEEDNNYGGGYNQGYNNNGEQGGYNRGSKGYGGKGGKGKGKRQNNDWNNNQSGGNNWGSGGNWGGNWN